MSINANSLFFSVGIKTVQSCFESLTGKEFGKKTDRFDRIICQLLSSAVDQSKITKDEERQFENLQPKNRQVLLAMAHALALQNNLPEKVNQFSNQLNALEKKHHLKPLSLSDCHFDKNLEPYPTFLKVIGVGLLLAAGVVGSFVFLSRKQDTCFPFQLSTKCEEYRPFPLSDNWNWLENLGRNIPCKGTCKIVNATYTGGFLRNNMHGEGIIATKMAAIDCLFQGHFEGGKPVGKGKIINVLDPTKNLEVDHVDGKEIINSAHDSYRMETEKNGKRKITWPNHNIYEGEYDNKITHGVFTLGVLTLSDGKQYKVIEGKLVDHPHANWWTQITLTSKGELVQEKTKLSKFFSFNPN